MGTSVLLGLNAFTNHLSLGVGGAAVEAMRAELEGYDVAKGTVRFSAARPLPAALVKKLVKARIAAHASGKA